MGNSARHMMAAMSPLLFLVAIVLASRIRSVSLRAALVVLFLVTNYLLGPSEGELISPSPRLDVLNKRVQEFVTNLHQGGRAFALLPVPAKMYVGGPVAPYGIFEVMARAARFETRPSDEVVDRVEFDPSKNWPRYDVTFADGAVYSIAVKEVTPPQRIGPLDDWFLFTCEEGILAGNRSSRWQPYLVEALRADPDGASAWVLGESMMTVAIALFVEIQRYDKALETLRSALDVFPNSAGVLYTGGTLFTELGRKDDARRLLTRFLRLHPNDPKAGLARQQLEALDSTGR